MDGLDEHQRVLHRTKVGQLLVAHENGVGYLRRDGRRDAGRAHRQVGALDHPSWHCQFAEFIPSLVTGSGFVCTSFVFWHAPKRDAAIWLRAKTEHHVCPQCGRIENIQRRFGRIICHRFTEIRKHRPSPSRAFNKWARAAPWLIGSGGREDDRLEQHQRAKQLRLAQRGHYQRGTAHRVACADNLPIVRGMARGRESVVAVANPFDLPIGLAGAVAVTAEVKCDAVISRRHE